METKEIRIIVDTNFHRRKLRLTGLTWKDILSLGLERAEKLSKKGR